MKKISIIVPVYNVNAELFDKCISSIRSQTMRDFELLLVDDGSEEYVAWRCDRMTESDERIRVFHQKNKGASAARNLGLEKSSGEYVTFVDCDDWIDEGMLERAYERIKRDDLDILLWGSYKTRHSGLEEYSPYSEDIPLFDEDRKKELMLKTMAGTQKIYTPPATRFGSGSCCSKLYRRSFLNKHGLRYPEGVERAEDVNFNIRCFQAADRIGYLHAYLYYYRQHEDSATYRYRHDGIEVFTKALQLLEDFIVRTKKDEDFRQTYYMRCMFFFLESMDMDYLNPKNREVRSQTLFRMQRAASKEPYRTAFRRLKYDRLSFAKKIPLFLLRHDMMGLLRIFYGFYRSLS